MMKSLLAFFKLNTGRSDALKISFEKNPIPTIAGKNRECSTYDPALVKSKNTTFSVLVLGLHLTPAILNAPVAFDQQVVRSPPTSLAD